VEGKWDPSKCTRRLASPGTPLEGVAWNPARGSSLDGTSHSGSDESAFVDVGDKLQKHEAKMEKHEANHVKHEAMFAEREAQADAMAEMKKTIKRDSDTGGA
jgi:hypothetical protein